MQTSHKIPKNSRHKKYGGRAALNRQHGFSCSVCPTSVALTPFCVPLTLLSLVSLLNFPFLCSLDVFYLSQQITSTGCGLNPMAGWQCHPLAPSGLKLSIYLLLKACKKQTCFIQTPWKIQIWKPTYWGIWGKSGGRCSNMPPTFLAVNKFAQLLCTLLQEKHILTESFSCCSNPTTINRLPDSRHPWDALLNTRVQGVFSFWANWG